MYSCWKHRTRSYGEHFVTLSTIHCSFSLPSVERSNHFAISFFGLSRFLVSFQHTIKVTFKSFNHACRVSIGVVVIVIFLFILLLLLYYYHHYCCFCCCSRKFQNHFTLRAADVTFQLTELHYFKLARISPPPPPPTHTHTPPSPVSTDVHSPPGLLSGETNL